MYKKTLIFLTILITLLGCGGTTGSDIQTKTNNSNNNNKTIYTNSGEYALWDYLVPQQSSTNNYIKTTGNTMQKYQTRYIKENNTVTESSSDVPNEKTIYTKNSNNITVSFFKDSQPNGHYELHTLVDIGDMVTIKASNCILKRHYDSFSFEGKTFEDVIAIECGNTPGYYQKGIGEIGQEQALNTTGRVIQVLSN